MNWCVPGAKGNRCQTIWKISRIPNRKRPSPAQLLEGHYKVFQNNRPPPSISGASVKIDFLELYSFSQGILPDSKRSRRDLCESGRIPSENEYSSRKSIFTEAPEMLGGPHCFVTPCSTRVKVEKLSEALTDGVRGIPCHQIHGASVR